MHFPHFSGAKAPWRTPPGAAPAPHPPRRDPRRRSGDLGVDLRAEPGPGRSSWRDARRW